MFSARIVLRETRAGTSYPLPPDRHELSYYTDVDLFVNTNDFDRPTSPLGTFETDGNLPQQKFEFDVARLVTHLRGAKIGFRVKLDADPTYAGMGFLGTAFSGSSTPSGVRIGRMGLAARLEASLLAPLQQVGDILRDDHPDNDRAACAKLGEFITEVKAHEQDGLLLVTQYTDLEELAQNIMTSLGCPGRSPGGASVAG